MRELEVDRADLSGRKGADSTARWDGSEEILRDGLMSGGKSKSPCWQGDTREAAAG